MNDVLLTPIRLNELEILIENSLRKVIDQSSFHKEEPPNEVSDLLDIKQASILLGLAVPTIYAKVSDRLIPHSKKGKKLFFSKTQLTDWVKSGQRKTVSDLENEAKNYIKSKK